MRPLVVVGLVDEGDRLTGRTAPAPAPAAASRRGVATAPASAPSAAGRARLAGLAGLRLAWLDRRAVGRDAGLLLGGCVAAELRAVGELLQIEGLAGLELQQVSGGGSRLVVQMSPRRTPRRPVSVAAKREQERPAGAVES